MAATTARDRQLGEELAALLRAHESSSSFLEVATRDGLVGAPAADRKSRLPVGSHLGPYEIVGLLGVGGMGEVYRARDPRLSRDVAIKVLPAMLAADPSRQQRMEREARAVGMLNHPNTLVVYDVGVHQGSPYIVSELLEGTTLREQLEKRRVSGGAVPVDEALPMVREIVSGLEAAHRRGVVHRDLKPENIFVTMEGRIKILDFGLAKLTSRVGDGEVLQTAIGAVMGTAGYMAPEQVRGQSIGPPADVFAVGAIFYELLAGRRPFVGNTAAEVMAAILTSTPAPLKSIVPGTPDAVAAIVERCLAKEPDARYPSAAELAKALRLDPATVTSEAARPFRSGLSARATLAAGVAMGLLAIVAGGAWWLSRYGVGQLLPPADADTIRLVVAVRPFTNVSADAAKDYFSARMTEEIRSQLSKIAALRLLSRSAVSRYSEPDVHRMAKELGVGSVVEGTVRVEDERVRITVQRINARNEQSIWGEQYDRKIDDIFAVQSDVALRVATALRSTLTPDERERVTRKPTANGAAFEIYLKAQELPPDERQANRRAIEMLRQALHLDPTFALAQARMAYRMLWYDDPSGNLDLALDLARKAVALDSTLDAGYSALAAIHTARGEIADARIAYHRAMELNPSQFEAMTNLSNLEAHTGRLDEALLWARRAFPLAPNTSTAYYHVGLQLIYLGDETVTKQWLDRALQRFPQSTRLAILQALLAFESGRVADSEALARKAAATHPKNDEVQTLLAELAYLAGAADAEPRAERGFNASSTGAGLMWIGAQSPRVRYAHMLARRGEARRAGQLLSEALRLALLAQTNGDQSPTIPLEIAAIHAARDERGAALDSLQRAYDGGWRYSRVLMSDPMFATLRQEPRFQALVKRIDDDIAAMRRRVDVKETLEISLPPAPSVGPGG